MPISSPWLGHLGDNDADTRCALPLTVSPQHNCRIRELIAAVAFLCASKIAGVNANGQSATFAGNAQHTAVYSAPAQHLDAQRWSTVLDLENTGAMAHYGAPLVTPANTVLAPIRTTTGFEIKAFEGPTGRLKYTLSTDYVLPTLTNNAWVLAFQPALATSSLGISRLYYPGAGGTLYYIENPDSDTPDAPIQRCFYTDLNTYQTNRVDFNRTVFVNTLLTPDTNGVIFFGFHVEGMAPAPLGTTNSGFARMDWSGRCTFVLVNEAAGDKRIGRDSIIAPPP